MCYCKLLLKENNSLEYNVDNQYNMRSLILADSFLLKSITNKLSKNKFLPPPYIYNVHCNRFF